MVKSKVKSKIKSKVRVKYETVNIEWYGNYFTCKTIN